MPRVSASVYIDEDLRERFKQRFGSYGALSFVLEAALREILDMTEGQPDIEELSRQAIRIHVLRTHYSPKATSSDE